jgi:hypothetical protein
MLAVIVAAGLFPNTGTVRADAACPYGGCGTSSSLPTWELVSILVAIAAAAIAVALLVMNRRRRPPPGGPVQAWQGAPPAGAAPTGPAGPTPPYVETPEDVGQAPPAVSPGKAAAVAGVVAAPAAAEAEPDIDSLMAELDKISGEILKKPPKKGAGGSSASLDEDETKSS